MDASVPYMFAMLRRIFMRCESVGWRNASKSIIIEATGTKVTRICKRASGDGDT